MTASIHNVMILSWLTATNNEGKFMFSLNKHRHTASVIRNEFTLSVPVQGMEDLVLSAGGVSAKWGYSKFPNDHPASSNIPNYTAETTSRVPHRNIARAGEITRSSR